jgi:hypothetical protein
LDDKEEVLANGHPFADRYIEEVLKETFFITSFSIIFVICFLFVLPMLRLLHV